MQEKNKIVRINSDSRSYPVYTRESTVRKAAAKPKRAPRPIKTEEERIREERRKRFERAARKHALEREIRNRYEKANIWNHKEAMILCILLSVMLVSCLFMLHQEAVLSELQRSSNNLSSQYAELAHDNNVLESTIEGELDYQAIYEYATGTLGMHYPKKSQIVTYQGADHGTVYQNAEIPGAE